MVCPVRQPPFPGARPGGFSPNQQAGRSFNQSRAGQGQQGEGGYGTADSYYGPKSNGVIPYINLKDVTLAEAL